MIKKLSKFIIAALLINTNTEPSFINLSLEVLIIDSNGLLLYSESTSHIARQNGWNLKLSTLKVDDNFIEVGVDRTGYQKMEGSVCQLKIVVVDGSWEKSIALDIYGSAYAPSKTIDRPDEIEDGAEVSATVSCLAPWDVDDNPEDDSYTVYASNRPIVTYESSDVYWTIGIGLLMLVVAFFSGMLNFQRPEQPVIKEKKSPEINQESKPETKQENEVEVIPDDISLDDMSFDQEPSEIQDEAQSELPIEDEMIEPEEEVIDIDDSTASGRLSALRREMASDSGQKDNSRDELSKRMDSFLKDR